MPVEFLSDDQAARYGHFDGPPTADQLARYFYLSDADRAVVDERRNRHGRLGFAVQLGTVRFLGTFPADLNEVPAVVVHAVGNGLGVPDPEADFARYLRRDSARREHAAEIQGRYGYTTFGDPSESFRMVRWLYARAWLAAERPSVLFDLATARLVERKVLLPGVTVLARLVARVRARASDQVYEALARLPTDDQRKRLEDLLAVPEGDRVSRLERLRRSPVRVSGPALVEALGRVERTRALGGFDDSGVPPARREALARYAMSAWARTLSLMPEARRVATLVAFAEHVQRAALDDALDLFGLLVESLFRDAERDGKRERLRRLREFDQAALRLWAAVEVLLDRGLSADALRETVFGRISRAELEEAGETVTEIAREPGDRFHDEVLARWRSVRRYLPSLLETVTFEGTRSAAPVLDAVDFLRELEERTGRPAMGEAPLSVLTPAWERLVLADGGGPARKPYTFGVLDELLGALRRRDVFVPGSGRWDDPRAKLLQGERWEQTRPSVCRALGRAPSPDDELAALQSELDEAYRRTAANLDTNEAVRIEQTAGRDRLVVTPLDKLDEPESLVHLRAAVQARMPHVELPELLLEVEAWTGFTFAFTHASEGRARAEGLDVSLCAALLSEACNVGLRPFSQVGTPALTTRRLSWVLQNYVRAETLVAANARLVDYQATIPLAQAWGGGEVASADGLRFVVPVRTLNAGPNPKYFGVGQGVTYYNFTSDQFTGFHAVVVPGTLRDSLYVLSGLLEQQTGLEPTEIVTDTAGYSDTVFGLFWLLGYQFSPRLADLGDARLWRMDRAADYGPLDGVARQRVRTSLIRDNWDDLLRVAGSLKTGAVGAHEMMRVLQRGNRPSTLAKAVGELGRIAKTLFLLAYVDDEAYRRRVLTQLNRQESRHKLARTVFHGQRGEVRKRYREGQEDQLSALGLVVNAVVLWTTRYQQAALDALRSEGAEVLSEDVARLSPLGTKHVNVLGQYHFELAVARGELRPLRDPAAPDEGWSGPA
ncbi:Tn3 family transposase [Rubrivirga sp.]|uniref:Tn3 family transposase n=1 Tax=Rubrivirga sp. TaxID=1885344 RepID=UPI003C72DF7C